MYRVLVVDDEPLIVNSLCSSIEQNFEIELYRANSAFSAMSILRKTRFDLVITDIAMPVMNGLELLKWIRSVWPQCYVILLTAYDKFDYVYESIKYERVQYILKLENYAVIHQAIQAVLDKMNAEKKQEQTLIELGAYMEQIKPLICSDLVSRLLRYGISLPDQQLLDNVGIAIRKDQPACLVVGMLDDSLLSSTAVTFPEVTALSMNRISRRGLQAECLLVGSYIVWLLQRMPSFLSAGDEATWRAILCDIFEELPDMLDDKNGAKLMLVTNACMHPISELKNIFSRLTIVLEQERNESGMHIFTTECEPSTDETIDSSLNMDDITHLWECLKSGDSENFRQALVERLKPLAAVADMTETHPSTVVSAITYLYLCAMDLYGIDRQKVSLVIRGGRHLSGQQWIGEVVRAFDQLFDEKAYIQESGMAWIVGDVRAYITEHFMDDIHLTTLADNFHYSPSYLSRMYKKTTGESLTGAINNQRMLHAKSLLELTALPVAEVAHQSGFYSTKYFLQLFKKKTGITPSQYRKNTDQ